MIKVAQNLVRKCGNYVHTDNMELKEFVIRNGIRQGGTLIPFLFIVVLKKNSSKKL